MAEPRCGRLAAFAASTLSGIGYGLAQPGFGWWPLAWVAFAPLLVALRGRAAASRAQLGGWAGAVAVAVGCVSQAAFAFQRYADWSPGASLLASSGVGVAYGVVGFALFAAAVPGRSGSPARFVSAAIAALALVEGGRSFGPLALPWFLHVSAFATTPGWIQGASWVGAAGWSGCLLAPCAIAVAPGLPPTRRIAAISIAVLFLWAPAGLDRRALETRVVHVAAIHLAASSERDDRALAAALTAASEMAGIAFVVAPENATRALLPENGARLPRRPNLPVVIGAPRVDHEVAPVRLHASAFVLDGDRVDRVHDKFRLVPFFEQRLVGVGLAGAELSRGAPPRIANVAELPVGIALCYETLFAADARRLANQGARLQLHLSNEEWFGGHGAHDQMLTTSQLRAVENGVPVLRVTRGGVSASIDPSGSVLDRHIGDSVVRPLAVELPTRSGGTVWRRTGPWFWSIVWMLLLIAAHHTPGRGSRTG